MYVEPVRHVHHTQPFVAHGLERRDAIADAVHEDFSTAARNGTKTSFYKIADDLLDRFFEELLERDELARAETVDVHRRELRFDV